MPTSVPFKASTDKVAIERFAGKIAHQGKLVTKEEAASLAQKGVPVSGGSPRLESPFDRFMRLKNEIASFQGTVAHLSDKSPIISQANQNLNKVESQTDALIEGSGVWSFLPVNSPAPSTVVGHDSGTKVVSEAISSLHSGKTVKYEVTSKSTSGPSSTAALMADKVAVIEQAVGDVTGDALNQRLSKMLHEMQLLDAERLGALSRRIQHILREFAVAGGAAERKHATATEESEAKVKALEDATKSHPSPMGDVATTVSKLQSKSTEHQRAAECLVRIQRLQRQSMAVQQTLSDDTAALNALAKSMVTNMAVMKANAESLTTKLK